jgi:Phosphatidylserine/phosphatidylglycerophosphate/cardiolipin synthases and related enzymes
MKLIIQPRDGVKPLIDAIARAKRSIWIAIFRFDLTEVEQALQSAIKRGVTVQALIAHTSGGGEKQLRNLESRLLEAGAWVARTDDDMVRYHGKLLVIDNRTLFVLGFNYTALDIRRSRSLGVIVQDATVVREARRLLATDADRSQKYRPKKTALVISPENARARLRRFIRKARRELLIYDVGLSDDGMLEELQKRAEAGVVVKIIGKVEKKWESRRFRIKKPARRLHVRAIVRDSRRAFVGSQSLRRLELDERREVGIVIRQRKIVGEIVRVFNADWHAR